MTAPVIRLEGIGKRYVKYDDEPMLAKAMLRLPSRTKRSQLWAVRGLDLEVRPGDCVGIVGRNGSGKSTTLQMISGITQPTEGRLRVEGRVAPLISVGVGFHKELSGRDNVYVNGSILGLTRAEIDRRLEEVVAFAEMEQFIDTPVKFYSSGMTVRLGFSMAVQATPDILLVDEVLAVGDLAFQVKCFERMSAIRKEGTTIVVVSHNLNVVRQLCDRGVVLHAGEKKYDGGPAEAISLLHELLQEDREIGEPQTDEKMPFEPDMVEVDAVDIVGPNGRKTNHVKAGDEVTVRIKGRTLQSVSRPFVALTVTSAAGVVVYRDTNRRTPHPVLKAGETFTYEVKLDCRLTTGSFLLQAMVGRVAPQVLTRLAVPRNATFFVSGRKGVRGVADLGGAFTVGSAPAAAKTRARTARKTPAKRSSHG